jgi:phospholipid/cholesterol/gamma-HCH transport system permease protein
MQCTLEYSRPSGETLLLQLAGQWKTGTAIPEASAVEKELTSISRDGSVRFDTEGITVWDSSLLTFLIEIKDRCVQSKVKFDDSGLPEGVKRLLTLAAAVPERKDARKQSVRESFLARVGSEAVTFGISAVDMLSFIGEACVAVLRLLRGKSRLRVADLFAIMQDCGARALPIVSLISMLVGLILAFVGAIQLMVFGAQIYVASLVGIAMVRVMGAVMAGIIMAGRTGAAFAAQLGTMQVNEEIDALKTLGISPMEFLVLPRMLALALMMPLLCLYADLMGILGGLIVGVGMLDLNLMEYYQQTATSIKLNDLWIGLFQSFVFGILVAVAGCLRGMQCERSASAVGEAATSAVVTGIVSIVVATALVTIMCSVLGV